jgi:hypothetical protein
MIGAGAGAGVMPSPLSAPFSDLKFSIVFDPIESQVDTSTAEEAKWDPAADNSLVTTAFFKDRSGRTKLLAEVCCTTGEDADDTEERLDVAATLSLQAEALLELYHIAKKQVDAAQAVDAAGVTPSVGAQEPASQSPLSEEKNEGQVEEKISGAFPGWNHSLLFECQCRQDNVIVEGVNLVGTTQRSPTEIRFHLDITARATKADTNPASQNDTESLLPHGIPPVTSTLDITAVLLAEKVDSEWNEKEESDAVTTSPEEDDPDPLMSRVGLGLLALELGGGISPPPPLPYQCEASIGSLAASPYFQTNKGFSRSSSSAAEANNDGKGGREAYHYGVNMTYAGKAPWNIRLVQPLVVNCSSIGGARAAVGATLVSISISHSNAHPHPVLVTNIALHPGNSSLYVWNSGGSTSSPRTTARQVVESKDQSGSSTFGRSMPGGSTDVIDMTRHVRWTYAMGTAPSLPLKLMPYETFSTVLQIDAGEDLRSRTFVSPVAVTAVVDRESKNTASLTMTSSSQEGGKDGVEEENSSGRRSTISMMWDGRPSVIASDAIWTTERVATVPADALRVDMSLRESRYKVGAPLVVALRVLNLSNEDRNLMLLMAKDESSSNSGNNNFVGGYGGNNNQRTPKSKSHTVNTAVVSEVNGYTFGVWGLSGEDDGTTRQNRDHELLAVDAALLLGDVKGQHSVEAELRFVPLREGTLDVPNLKLYDKSHGKWYNCIHCLKIVAAESE